MFWKIFTNVTVDVAFWCFFKDKFFGPFQIDAFGLLLYLAVKIINQLIFFFVSNFLFYQAFLWFSEQLFGYSLSFQKITYNLGQNICRYFHFLAQFLFNTSEVELDYYNQKVKFDKQLKT